MARRTSDEAERKTRKDRIDPKLDAAGWRLKGAQARRSEEEATANGPADYALWLGKSVAGVVEAKKVTVGPQNVLTQSERYARGLDPSVASGNFDGHRCPFLYSTNGEVFWFHDVRHTLNRSRRVAGFHTPSALSEMLGRDFEGACDRLAATPNDSTRLRPYQKAANAAVEKAIAERKRSLLVAMATGTGKTFTFVNQIYRLMKAGVARRVLFLVDRRALAAQAVRAFSAFEVESAKKFDDVYEVYSSRFQAEDLDDDQKFDPKLLPQKYLTDPQPGHAFVYVATIQRMAINVLGRDATPGTGDEPIDDDAKELLEIVKDRALLVDEWPPRYRIRPDPGGLPTSGTPDERIARYSVDRAEEFIAEKEESTDPDTRVRVAVVERLLLERRFGDSGRAVATGALIENLSARGFAIIDENWLRRVVIAPLRDRGLLITSSQQGYKLPDRREDLALFARRAASISVSMINRVKAACDAVKLATMGEVDVLADDDLASFKKLAAALDDMSDVAESDEP